MKNYSRRPVKWWLSTPLYASRTLRKALKAWRSENVFLWNRAGRPIPIPHAIKRREVLAYRARFDVLVETGTFYGAMVRATQKHFAAIHSIELSEILHGRAARLFGDLPHIQLYLGDSAQVIPQILETLSQPALFWLDGHAMGLPETAHGAQETPLWDELRAITRWAKRVPAARHSVILIDDARYFGIRDWPTVAQIERFVREDFEEAEFEIKLDCLHIRLQPLGQD